MAFDFKGKRVVVCGGSRGIGRSIALGFAAAGAGVSICARGEDGLKATAAEIAARGVVSHYAPCDLASAEAIAGYIPAAAKALGGIDVLVNNASGFGMGDDEAGWEKGLNVDVMATVRASRAALTYLEAAKGASIVNIASISGYRASTRTPAYAAVKAAVIQYTTSQAAALAPKGIRVNCVAPGSIEFPGGTWEARRSADPALYNKVLSAIPFNRLGTPEEIANVVLFLASPYASWVTAQTVTADGGQLLG
ncbi:MAG: SDR family oxidoreductase [Proteobacteria bacterium]|nr:SDR family oxidoreductase [Pseudomonadota bacterium]